MAKSIACHQQNQACSEQASNERNVNSSKNLIGASPVNLSPLKIQDIQPLVASDGPGQLGL